MAVQRAITTRHGISLPTAYVIISQIIVDARTVQYTIRTYANAAARTADRETLDEQSFSFPNAANLGNVMNACYANLQASPGYAGSFSV